MISTAYMFALYKTCCAGYRLIHACAHSSQGPYDLSLIPRKMFYHVQTSTRSRTWLLNVQCRCETTCSFMALPVQVRPVLFPKSSNDSVYRVSVSCWRLSQIKLLIICSNDLILKAYMNLCVLEAHAASTVLLLIVF